MSKGLKNVSKVCIISGLISIILVEVLFFFVFPTALFFLLIPVIMGYSIAKFAEIPYEELLNKEAFEKLRTRTGIICAAFMLITVLISVLPIILLLGICTKLVKIIFFVSLCLFVIRLGYTFGARVVSETYYAMTAH